MFDFNCLICIRWIFYDKKETKYIFISRPRCVFCLCEWVPLSLPPSLSLSGQLFVFHQFGINSKLRTKSEFELNTNRSHLIFCSLVTRAQAHRFACRLTESCVAGDSVFCAIVSVCNGQCCFRKCSPLLHKLKDESKASRHCNVCAVPLCVTRLGLVILPLRSLSVCVRSHARQREDERARNSHSSNKIAILMVIYVRAEVCKSALNTVNRTI